MGRAYAQDSSLAKGVNTVFSNQSGISGLSDMLMDEQNQEFRLLHVKVDSFRRVSCLKEEKKEVLQEPESSIERIQTEASVCSPLSSRRPSAGGSPVVSPVLLQV